MEEVVLLIGGNLGDREGLINQALEKLEHYFPIHKKSSIYETEAWGGSSSGNYLNMALSVMTGRSPEEVLNIAQQVESELGRTREVKWGDRTMDIDIIYFGSRIIQSKRLKIPHPLMAERKFVLLPLVEILPDFVHPKLKMSNRELLVQCPDNSSVMPYFSS